MDNSVLCYEKKMFNVSLFTSFSNVTSKITSNETKWHVKNIKFLTTIDNNLVLKKNIKLPSQMWKKNENKINKLKKKIVAHFEI